MSPPLPAPAVHRWLAILNPAAGALIDHGRADALAQVLQRDLGLTVLRSTAPGQLASLARSSDAFDGLVAVGGDGTVAELVNGMDLRRQDLALLPAGTGNGLARDLGLRLPSRGRGLDGFGPALAALASTLRQPRPSPIDLIELHYRRPSEVAWTRRLAVSTTALGYAAEVVSLAKGPLAPLARRLPTGLRYPLAATLQVLRQRRLSLRFGLDDAPPSPFRASNLMVQSTAHAGNFRAFPAARPNDGRLTVLLADAGPLAQLRHNVAVLRQSYGYATAETQRATSASLQSERPLRLMVDGEVVDGVTELRWEVLAGALRMAV